MTTQTYVHSSSSIAFTTTTLSSLANVTYVTSTAAVDLGTPVPLDDLLELAVTVGSVSGNQQVLLFVQVSVDGANYTSGPTSGTTVTDQPDLYYVGRVPCNTSSSAHRGVFSLYQALGFVPRYYKPVVFNDSGAALTAGTMSHTTVKGDSQ